MSYKEGLITFYVNTCINHYKAVKTQLNLA